MILMFLSGISCISPLTGSLAEGGRLNSVDNSGGSVLPASRLLVEVCGLTGCKMAFDPGRCL